MVREFVVRTGCEHDFELIFKEDGIWCDLVRSCANRYQGCELTVTDVRRYEVRDYWTSHWDFEAFREQRQFEIEQFRDWMAGES